jgi:ferric enterobactin receptor
MNTIRILFALLMGFSTLGYAQTTSTGRLPDSTISFHQVLKAVTVTAKPPTIVAKADKLVYNAADDLTSQGGVALDVLRKVPMVSVDIDGNVELQGDGNVRFLINGKPSGMFGSNIVEALQAIPASQIKSIEVMTSPGAQYDAAGTAGIINIVLKDNKMKGVNGSVNVSAGTRLENGSFNFNARKGDIGINAFFSGSAQLRSTTLNTFNRESYNSGKDTLNYLSESGLSPYTRNGYQSGLSLTWSVTPKDELTVTVGYGHTGKNETGDITQNDQTIDGIGNMPGTTIGTRTSTGRFMENPMDWSMAYKRTFKKEGREFNFLYTSALETSSTDASQLSEYPNGGYPASGLRSQNPGRDHETDISIDYAEPLAKGFILETGAKAILENINNNTVTDTLSGDMYVPNASQTYVFQFNRDIYAAYAIVSYSFFHDWLSGQAGLRYERTHTGSDFKEISIPDNDIWAPSFLLQHKLDETQALKFTYSYRVERPDYDDLNPYVDLSDPNNISTGNPLLKTELGHKFELGYSKRFGNQGNIYFGGYYNYNTNDAQTLTVFYPVYIINGVEYHNISVAQPESIGLQTTVGATIFGSARISNKLNLRSDIALREIDNIVPGVGSVSGFTYKINGNADYSFDHDLLVEIFGNYTSRRTVYESVRPAYLFYTLAIKKQLLGKKFSFGFTASNFFTGYIHQLATSYGTGFTQSNLRLVPLRSFGLTLSYRFGKLQTKDSGKEEDFTPPPPGN